jgi:hypothetical protein
MHETIRRRPVGGLLVAISALLRLRGGTQIAHSLGFASTKFQRFLTCNITLRSSALDAADCNAHGRQDNAMSHCRLRALILSARE